MSSPSGNDDATTARVADIAEDDLQERIATTLRTRCASERAALPALTPCMTNALLSKVHKLIWSNTCPLHSWTRQRALAVVVASISGGRPPTWESAERPGQRMCDFLSRYDKRLKSLLAAEKAAEKRRQKAGTAAASDMLYARSIPRKDLEDACYYCTYGCTPASLPVRLVPPGARSQEVEYIQSSIAQENLSLRKENNKLRQMETEVVCCLKTKLHTSKVELTNSVASEHNILLALDHQQDIMRKRESEAQMLASKLAHAKATQKQLESTLKRKAGELLLMQGHVSRAHVELEREQKRMARSVEEQLLSAEQSKTALLQQISSLSERIESLQNKVKTKEKELLSAQSVAMQRGAQLARAHVELAREQDLNKAQMQLLMLEKRDLESELEVQMQKTRRARELKNEMASKKRKAEARACTSARRLERAQEAETSLKDMQLKYDELHESQEQEASTQVQKLECEAETMQQFTADKDDRGRFAAFHWRFRVLIISWLMRRTPPSAIGANLVDAAKALAPGKKLQVPSLDFIRKMRQEGTLLGEAMACFRVAHAKRVLSFGFDETSKLCDGLASTNVQIETEGGEISDEVLRGAFLIPGGTSEQVARAMESKLFTRGRKILRKWESVHNRLFSSEGAWERDGGPKPSQLGYHLLAGSLIMSDTCNAARKAKRLIIELVGQEVEKNIGSRWAQMSDEEKTEAKKCYIGDCMQHLRNILIDAMAGAATSMLQDELAESLEAFSAFERMSTDCMQLIRAMYKEFHHKGDYAKGKGKEFDHWRRTSHASTFYINFERAKGARQDLAFDGAVPIFANRALVCSYLQKLIFAPNHKNILEDFIWHTLSCVEMVALVRVLTLWNLVLSMPLRWLCGSSAKMSNWSVYKMGSVLDLVEEFLQDVATDGNVLLRGEVDIFASIAAEQPAFKNWREEMHNDEIATPDGTNFKWHAHVLNEARAPQNRSNIQATDMTVQLAQVMAIAGLAKMRDPKIAISDWLTSQSGQFAVGVSETAHAATVGAHTTNDRVESNFGAYDYVLRAYESISVDAASGMAQHMRMHFFDSAGDSVAHNRRSLKSSLKPTSASHGFFERLPESLQQSGVEMARILRNEAREWERADRREQAEYRELKRQQHIQQQLEALAEKGAIQIERFDAYASRADKNISAAKRHVAHLPSVSAKLAYLREQIELRVLGLGWSDLATVWRKSDEEAHESVSRLLEHLSTVLATEAERQAADMIPSEPPMPDFKAKSMKQLGMATADSEELAKAGLCSPEQLQAAVQREYERRAAAGFSDAVQAVQPQTAPTMNDDLLGVALEVCWHYISTEDNKTKVPIWCPATVVRVADGETDKGRNNMPLSSACRTIAPRGMLLLQWAPDPDRGEHEVTMSWCMLDPKKWNTDRSHRGWRFHPEELAKRKHHHRSENS